MKRCFDYRVIKAALGFDPVIGADMIYLNDNGNIWTFEPVDGVYRIHANMTTKKGKEAIASAREAFKTFFTISGEQKVIAKIPKHNKKACVIARACMRFTGKDSEHHYYEVNNAELPQA